MKSQHDDHHDTRVGWLKRNLIAGLAVATPILITFWVFKTVVVFLDNMLVGFIPNRFHLSALIFRFTGIELGFDVPGLGLIVALALLVLMGILIRNVIGKALFEMWEAILDVIPGVRSIYRATKQITETFTAPDSNAFRRVVMVEYPRRDTWSIAFVSDEARGQVQATSEKKLLNIFVPTTPNPTSGFLLFVPEEETIPLEMTVEEALKLVISAGLVTPDVPTDSDNA